MPPQVPEPLTRVPVPLPSREALLTDPEFLSQKSSSRLEALLRSPQPEESAWRSAVAETLLTKGELPEAQAHAERAVDLAGEENALGEALRVQTLLDLHVGDFTRARDVVGRLYSLAYGSRGVRSLERFNEAQGLLRLRTGDLAAGTFFEAECRFRAALRSCEALGDQDGRLRSYDGLASSLSATGSYPAAIEQVDVGLELCFSERAWRYVPALLLDRAFALRDLGLHEPASEGFRHTAIWAEAMEDVPVLARCWMGYMVLLGYDVSRDSLSGLSEIERSRDRCIALAKASHAHPVLMEVHLRAADIYEKLEMPDRASMELENAIKATPKSPGDDGRSFLVVREIERRELEAKRSERFVNRIRETLESSPDALLILDPVRDAEGRIVDLISEFRNSAADTLCGCVSSDVRTLRQLSEHEAFRDLAETIFEAIESRELYEDEVCMDGSSRWLARRIAPVGEGVAITVRDVTLQHSAADALREAAERAREADRAKSVFLANMSHEVRTPINGVLGLARLISETELSVDQRSYIEGIIASADILLGVLGGVLDLSKIEAGRVDLSFEPVDLRKITTDVVALFAGQAAQRGVKISSEVLSTVPATVTADGTRLRQVLANLVGNAVKFTTDGSVRVEVRPAGERIRFEVVDTGPGIPPQQLDLIFEAFRQGGNDATAQGGTGLGLTISRKMVEMMNGTIGVVSQLGEGSRFWFELALPVVEAKAVTVTAAPERFPELRVLLVEDNPVNTLVASGLLSQVGCQVEAVTEGVSAVRRVREGEFDLVLMDVRMPGMDGLEATRRIRQGEAGSSRRIPIVALTASAFTDDRDECFEAGMDDYLGKPFTPEALRSVLARWAPKTA